MSFSTGLNKKNLKLKNITYMSPMTQTKLNITNLLSETQRIMKTNNDNNNQLNNYFHHTSNLSNFRNNNLMNDLYKSYSSNRQNNYLMSNHNSERVNKKLEKNNYIKKPNLAINSHVLTFSQFTSNMNNKKNNISSYTPSYSSKNYLRKANSNSKILEAKEILFLRVNIYFLLVIIIHHQMC